MFWFRIRKDLKLFFFFFFEAELKALSPSQMSEMVFYTIKSHESFETLVYPRTRPFID
jgi:hypothetical protein